MMKTTYYITLFPLLSTLVMSGMHLELQDTQTIVSTSTLTPISAQQPAQADQQNQFSQAFLDLLTLQEPKRLLSIEKLPMADKDLSSDCGIDFTADGTQTISGSYDLVQFHDAVSAKLLRTIKITGEVCLLKGLKSGTDLPIVLKGDTECLVDLQTEQSILIEGYTEEKVPSAISLFNRHGQGLRVPKNLDPLEGSNALELFNSKTGAVIHTLQATSTMMPCAFSRDGTIVLTCDDDSFFLWDVSTGKLLRSLPFVPQHPFRAWEFPLNSQACDVSPTGKQIAYIKSFFDDTHEVRIIDGHTGSPKHTLCHNESDRLTCLAYSEDGSKLAVAGSCQLRIWNTTTGQIVRTLSWKDDLGESSPDWATRTDLAQAVVFSPDGARLLLAAYTRRFLWNIEQEDPGITSFLQNLTSLQRTLLQALENAFAKDSPLQCTIEEWKTFLTFPESVVEKLMEFMKTRHKYATHRNDDESFENTYPIIKKRKNV